MAEIRLGSTANMKNINLGSVEIQEVYLGTVLVWQNNLGPTLMSITWDGTTLTGIPALVDMQQDDFTTSNANIGVNAEVTAGVRTISIVVGGLADPDNVDPATDDFIVGYRLQRPNNGGYVAGDPEDTGFNTFTAPIADFGAALPGATATYDTIEEEFTAGEETVASSTIQALLRNTDTSDDVVVSEGQTFRDSGEWILTIIDSRGGEKVITIPNIDLVYPSPSFTIGGQGRNTANTANIGGVITMSNVVSGTPPRTSITNAKITGPNTVTLSAAQAAASGPIVSRVWTCISGGCTGGPFTTDTINVTIPQTDSGLGNAHVWQLTETGRRWNGDSGSALTATRRVAFHSGASCSPGYTANASSFTYFSDGTNTSTCNPLAIAPAAPIVSCSYTLGGACPGFSWISGTSYTAPSGAACGETSQVRIDGTTSGSIIKAIAANGAKDTGGFPNYGYTCELTGLPSGVRAIDRTATADATDCEGNGAPDTLDVTVMETCFIPAPALGCSSCIFAGGRSGGIVNGTCSAVPRGGSRSTPALGSCGALSGDGVSMSIDSFSVVPFLFAGVVPQFQWSMNVSRTSGADTGAIGNARVTLNCPSGATNGSGTIVSLGNGFGHNGVVTNKSVNIFSGETGEECSLTLTVTAGTYTGSVTSVETFIHP